MLKLIKRPSGLDDKKAILEMAKFSLILVRIFKMPFNRC